MGVYKRGKVWWYKFTWNGEPIRESSKQTNRRVAGQIEAAHKTSLTKGEVGIRDRVKAPLLKDFIQQKFSPYIEARFLSKNNTLDYYRAGIKNLTRFARLANCRLDKITVQDIAAFVRTRRDAGLQVTSVNRQLEVLRRIFKLAGEWNETEKRLPRVEMLGGERHRDRVLSPDEEDRYLAGAAAVGVQIQDAYFRALGGIRARLRGKLPNEPKDPFLLRDVATVLIDCALRPEESFRLRWEYVRDGALNIPFGKTENARRTIPLSDRALRLMEVRKLTATSDWLFPAPTKSGHIEKSTLKKPHAKAYTIAIVTSFPLYTFRHTCLTRWAAHMDPYTLGYLAGHSDFSTTKRYIHPQAQTVLAEMERARVAQSGHRTGTVPILIA